MLSSESGVWQPELEPLTSSIIVAKCAAISAYVGNISDSNSHGKLIIGDAHELLERSVESANKDWDTNTESIVMTHVNIIERVHCKSERTGEA